MNLSIHLLIVITMLRKHKYKMMVEILVLSSFLVKYAAADTPLGKELIKTLEASRSTVP